MGLYVKYLLNPIDNESRDKREISVAKELGHKVLVCDLGEKDERRVVAGFDVVTRDKNRSKNRFIKQIQKVTQILFTDPKYLRSLKPDYLSCHDLFALFSGYLSTLFATKKPFLIYDAHEFEIGRNKKREKLATKSIMVLEKFLIKRCAFSIMVNDSIADEVCNVYKIPKEKRPVVVRSTPDFWQVDEDIIKQQRKKFISQLDMPEDTFLLMYHGVIQNGRGVENLICEVAKTKGTALILLGYVDDKYLRELMNIASEYGITDRVIYHQAVESSVLWQYVGAADLGVIPTFAFCKNHYYMLPNKFFENIQAMTPIITSNYPEMRRLVNKYDIGLCFDPDVSGQIAQTIETVKYDKRQYNEFKKNLVKAKQELCWRNEKTVLKNKLENTI